MDYSFIIPVFNEAESLPVLLNSIEMIMNKVGGDYEVIFIDDGSSDGSYNIIEKLHAKNHIVKSIKLRRNFGKSCALEEGFKVSKGDIIFTLDADLQDDPNEIPKFLSKIADGFDLVSGWKQNRKDPYLSKNLPSKFFNFIIRTFSGLKLHDYNCGFKAYKKVVVKRLSLYGDLHRYIPAIVHSMGFNVGEIPVVHHCRTFGKSKYGIERFFHGFFDFLTIIFLTKYLKRPMHFFGLIGGLLAITGFLVCSYLSILWLSGEAIGKRPLLILGVLLILMGGQLFSTGLIAEMITYGQQKKSYDSVVESFLD